jgi:hypothetical protein
MARYKAIDTSPRFLGGRSGEATPAGQFRTCRASPARPRIRPFPLRHPLPQRPERRLRLSAGMLLKVILCAYAQGVVSSRGIERLCREHVTFIALSGDSAPHFTTLAAFVSSLDEEVAQLFAQVLYLCDRQGLIGREMFAIDGVKLPSNASKAKSGTRADFAHQADKLEAAAKKMLERHRENDRLPVEPDLAEKSRQRPKA